eukprot:303360-Amphidinium_carterae.1
MGKNLQLAGKDQEGKGRMRTDQPRPTNFKFQLCRNSTILSYSGVAGVRGHASRAFHAQAPGLWHGAITLHRLCQQVSHKRPPPDTTGCSLGGLGSKLGLNNNTVQ